MGNANKVYDVKITETAWEQLIEHARFLANVSVEAANGLVDDFIGAANSLKQMPERCPWFTNDAIQFQKYRKMIIGKYHIMLFQVRVSTVYIVSVIDCRQDYGWLL